MILKLEKELKNTNEGCEIYDYIDCEIDSLTIENNKLQSLSDVNYPLLKKYIFSKNISEDIFLKMLNNENWNLFIDTDTTFSDTFNL